MLRFIRLCAIFCIVGCSFECMAFAQEPQKQEPSFWMKKKLEHSQTIFQALAQGDFEAMQGASEKLRLLNDVEHFVRVRNPKYRTQLEMFRDANEELRKQAGQKNLEGTVLAFHQLTLSCVNCHKLLRDPNEKEAKP